MTENQFQAHHHRLVREQIDAYEQAKQDFRRITAELTERKKERALEQWKHDNKEMIQSTIDFERKTKAEELEFKLREARDQYADKALCAGIDIELVKQIFSLTDEEAMNI